MAADRAVLVMNRPAGPLVVFDGDCEFCRQWVRRWRGMTGDRVSYRPWQEVGHDYPEIGEGGFRARVWLIEPDGRARGGAGAVFRLHALAGDRRWPDRLYSRVPAFARASEATYDLVARHRQAAMVATRLLCGSVDRRPSYRRTRVLFLRGMGVAYLAAFWSLAVQADGLIGTRGIAPVGEFLDRVGQVLGGERFWQVPTLMWLDPSDRALHALCWGGVVTGGLLIAGILAGECLVLLWLGYLSLMSVGQPFLGYQWDVLLLEAGLLAILMAPWGLRLDRAARGPSLGAIWLVRWLVFRLMFLSGVVKLASGDPTWSAWQAMRYHYETQPLPTWTSWYMHQCPPWFQSASVGFMFWAELVAPFFVFGPRRVRMVGFASIVLLQVLIAATGNFGFFNLLTIVLCLTLVEDRDWGREDDEPAELSPRAWWRRGLFGMAAAVIVAVTTMEGLDRSGLTIVFPEPLEEVRRWVAPWHSMNAYGLFAVMTTERPEIEVEGSADGEHWRTYSFRWKPGDVDRPPRFATPHLPRLDWQMWFAALSGDCRREPWFLAFERRLLEGSPEVLGLLRDNPFPDGPPRLLRARLYRYHFTGPGDRAWWRREETGWFCPPVGL
jgi:predicted DCC family thiol-disulfide oxidoreductase YuxK